MYQHPDQEEEVLHNKTLTVTNLQNEKPSVDLEYAADALDFLEKFTLQKITDPEQREVWIVRLSKVPQWKLKRLSDFTGRLEHVWKFFEDQKQHSEQMPEYLKSLPEPRGEISKCTSCYMKKIMGNKFSQDEIDKIEVIFVKMMNSRFPWLKMECVRKANLKKTA